MSRHRNVRSMNYQDEYDGYDDVYGHSVEDGDFCVSPTTAHYLSDRHNQPSLLGAFMTPDKINEEHEGSDEDQNDSLQESQDFQRPALSDIDEARLNSCLEEIRNIIGESTPEHLMVDAVIKCSFDYEKALSFILSQQEAPKPQRERRNRRDRDAEGGSISPGSSPSPPSTSPQHLTQILPSDPPCKTSRKLRDKRPRMKSGITGVDENCQENNKNIGNVLSGSLGSIADERGSGKPQLVTHGLWPRGKSDSGFHQDVNSNVQPMQGSFSLASFTQKYNQTPLNANIRGQTSPTHVSVMPKQHTKVTNSMDSSAKPPLLRADLERGSYRPSTDGPSVGGLLGSLAESFLHTTENAKAANELSQKELLPSSRPLPCPTGPLVANFQPSQNSPSSQGSPSLSDLARQHMDSEKGNTILSSAALNVKVTPHNANKPSQKFSLSSFFTKELESTKESSATPTCLLQNDQQRPERDSMPSQKFSLSLAALAQTHVGNSDLKPSVDPTYPTQHTPLDLCDDKDGCIDSAELSLETSTLVNERIPSQPILAGTQNVSLAELANNHMKKEDPPFPQLLAASTPHIPPTTSPPPGFAVSGVCGPGEAARSQPIKAPPGFGQINIGEIASWHSESYQKKTRDSSKDSVSSVKPNGFLIVKSARPSMFGQTMCVNNHKNTEPTERKTYIHPKFAFRQQISHDGSTTCQDMRNIAPFDFSTPSPDDLIKAKQRGAFTRNGERVAPTNPPPTEKPKFELREPPKPRNVIVTKGDPATADQQPARMTFSTSKKVSSGFTPDKDDAGEQAPEPNKDAVEAVRRNLEMDMAVGRADQLEAPSSNRTPAGSAHATPKKEKEPQEGGATAQAPRSTAQSKDKRIALKEYEKRSQETKTCINLVVIGHVDAGKSTLMGHMLVQLGFVNKKTIHKYEQESKKMGKASFAFAWVLDETEEERSRGVTMDVAQTRFETDSKVVTLLDAPGHKDFIPNMITGAAQADVAILVVNSTRGEFETGFEAGGQTREHAMLIRSLGVSQLCVAINKMDTVEWDKQRYEEITKKLGGFLKTAGFRESDVAYIPCSGLSGENLTKAPSEEKLSSWYTGPTLVQQIDKFKPPARPVEKAFRMCISDVFKGMGSGFSVAGMVQAGTAQPGEKVLVMPQGEIANIKSVTIDDIPMPYGFAGDNVTLTLTGIDLQNLTVGSILCDPSCPVPVTSRIRARVVIFNIDVPITQGFPVVFHYGAASEPAHIRKLVSQLHKSTGEVVRKKPRCITKNSNAVIEIELSRPNCIELYKDFKDLGRFMLRYSGSTIAAGLVTEILKSKGGKAD